LRALDSLAAWPFLVGGAICLVNSDNERDSYFLGQVATFQPLGGAGKRLSFEQLIFVATFKQ
jgi:hypothetical protein